MRWSAIIVVLVLFALALPAAASAKIQLLGVTSPVRHGGYASIQIRAYTRATCSIRVHYGSRAPIKAAGLGVKSTFFAGIVGWRWLMSPSATRGRWTIDVSCGANGSLRTTFLVN